MAEQPSSGYREKYFQALKEQERLEKQLGFQTDLLKKTLFQVATAASGMDTQLDASVMRLKETMRGGSGAQAVEQMEKVSAMVQQFERNRSIENSKAAKVLHELIKQYADLQLPKDVKDSLNTFSKAINKRLTNYRQYPVVLEELVKLQQIALAAASNPSQGLWQRIKGGTTLSPVGSEAPKAIAEKPNKNTKEASDFELSEESPSESVDNQELLPPQDSSADQDISRRGSELSGGGSLKDDEDNYQNVSKRIATTLSNLVEHIEPNDLIKHRVDIVSLRIKRGMDWYVLAVTLEDIRDILFLRYLQADEELSEYLNQVRAELGTIRDALAGAVAQDEAQAAAANTFSDHVSSGVDRIRASVIKEQGVEKLKEEVTEHISYISDALLQYKARPAAPLTEQLEQLVAQVKNIEQESEKTKEALEEQRHKATHDTLTGLPNREAYIERAFQEMQRFKRYCRPLTLAICDIDFFKKINDGYGHQAGDKVLKLIAKVISTRLRNVDFIARYGGEEFVIIMPETSTEQAFKVLDKIRSAVAKTPFRFKESPVQITISFGLAAFQTEDGVEVVFERADKALYKAKEEGRNRCIIAD